MNEQDENYGLLVMRFGRRDGSGTPDLPDEVAALLDHGDAMGWLSPTDKGQVLRKAAQFGHAKTVDMLLDRGVDVNAKDAEGNTALILVAQGTGSTETASVLLGRGADWTAKNVNGNTALEWASENGHTATASLLLDRGAEVNSVDQWGDTVLMGAARSGNTETVALLLDRGADVNAHTAAGKTALHVAMERGRTQAAAVLRAHQEAHALAATLDSARPPETVPEPPSPVRLSNDPMNRAPREDLGAPDPKPDKPRRVRL